MTELNNKATIAARRVATAIEPFEMDLGIRVVFGQGAVDRLGELARRLGAARALIVTDPGVVEAGHAEKASAALERESVESSIFSEVRENPTTREVDAGVKFASDCRPDLIVGLGGGSAMDCAKGVNFLLTNGGKMEDYWGTGKATKPMLPSIGVPTTAGTGSEAQSYALISHAETYRKMACGDRKARFRTVILDPLLTLSLPRPVLATAAIDAVSHAVESAVSRPRNPASDMFARQAWELLDGAFEEALDAVDPAAARGRLLLGAHLAGWAIEHSMLGAAHAGANPLTARFGVVHGQALGLMLPHVVRFNSGADGYQLLRPRPAPDESLAKRIVQLRRLGGLPERLRDCAVPESALEGLAREAAQEWTAGFNPKPTAEDDFLNLYRQAF